MLNTTELAQKLSLSKGRISQLVAAGKLDGCFSGAGRERRFDLDRVKAALQQRLDFGQMMGNGAATRRALEDLPDDDEPAVKKPASTPRDGAELPATDAGRYEMARAQKAEEEARALRRRNQEAEGTFVLASEVRREVARTVAQEVAEFEAVLRAGARDIADRLGVDFKMARKILTDAWRSHRAQRKDLLADQAAAADLSATEQAENI